MFLDENTVITTSTLYKVERRFEPAILQHLFYIQVILLDRDLYAGSSDTTTWKQYYSISHNGSGGLVIPTIFIFIEVAVLLLPCGEPRIISIQVCRIKRSRHSNIEWKTRKFNATSL